MRIRKLYSSLSKKHYQAISIQPCHPMSGQIHNLTLCINWQHKTAVSQDKLTDAGRQGSQGVYSFVRRTTVTMLPDADVSRWEVNRQVAVQKNNTPCPLVLDHIIKAERYLRSQVDCVLAVLCQLVRSIAFEICVSFQAPCFRIYLMISTISLKWWLCWFFVLHLTKKVWLWALSYFLLYIVGI